MSRLTDRRDGFVAAQMRARIEGQTARRLADAEVRVGRLERALAYRVRAFRGVRLEVPGTIIQPDAQGLLSFSGDGTLTVKRDPNLRGEHAKWAVDLPADVGCGAAITTNADCDGTELHATACDAKVTHTSGNGYVAVQVTGTANKQTLNYHWCAPPAVGPPPGATPTLIGDPVTWAKLVLGDACLGGCAEYIVPLWAVTPPE